MGDLNHIRRLLTQCETSHFGLAAVRVLRFLVKPKPTGTDVRLLLELEARFSFRSTFFILHDSYWSRQEPRYRLGYSAWPGSWAMVKAARGEIGVHGAITG